MSGTRGPSVLAIHRYYWPDTPPYASILRTIARRWVGDGARVDILTAQPSYKPELNLGRRPRVERVDESQVKRIAMKPDRSSRVRRVFNVAAFPLAVFVRVLIGRRYDVVMCSTAPPVTLGALVSLAARVRRSRFVYHCMDIHPEIGAISGEFGNPRVRRVLTGVDTATCRRAAAVVVLSSDMREALLARDAELADRIHVINNFDLPSFDDQTEAVVAAAPLPEPASGVTRIVFTGNLGRFQGLDVLVETVISGDERFDSLELVLMGEGAAKADLERRVAALPADRAARVVFVPHGTPAEARALIRTADYGVVSLTPGVIRYAYPSKTATYLAEGTPVVVLVESDSALARDVAARGFGTAAELGDADAIRAALEDTLDPVKQQARAERALRAWKDDFSADVQLDKWSDLLAQVSEPREAVTA